MDTLSVCNSVLSGDSFLQSRGYIGPTLVTSNLTHVVNESRDCNPEKAISALLIQTP